jgi:predicted nuclease of restriction endonuclease-like (RecB) superfamily
MRVPRDQARAFYEIEAARECWSVRQLERQIGALLFERLAKHRNPDEVRALARDGQEVAKAADVIKDPFVLEFLDLGEHPALRERDVEQAIIDRLGTFLLELGKGFCFVGRQKRLTIDSDHFYVDLVFYNRILRCFVLMDLLGPAGTLFRQRPRGRATAALSSSPRERPSAPPERSIAMAIGQGLVMPILILRILGAMRVVLTRGVPPR